MNWFNDIHNRRIRFSEERHKHIELDHPEMANQMDKINELLSDPDKIVQSSVDPNVELFYRHYSVNSSYREIFMCSSQSFG